MKLTERLKTFGVKGKMHSLINGITSSGKTYLAKQLCAGFKRKGRKTIVYDIFLDDWQCDFVTNDADKFLWTAKHNYNAALFIDESGASIGRGVDARPFHWCATMSRHWGHKSFFLMQRITQIEPIIRSQCSEFYCFRGSQNDADLLIKETGSQAFEVLPRLPQYSFLHYAPFQPPKIQRINAMKTPRKR